VCPDIGFGEVEVEVEVEGEVEDETKSGALQWLM
jgi:hypothetical protein